MHWLLGIEVTRNRDERIISLSQQTYLESIIRRFGFEELKSVSTPPRSSTRARPRLPALIGPSRASRRSLASPIGTRSGYVRLKGGCWNKQVIRTRVLVLFVLLCLTGTEKQWFFAPTLLHHGLWHVLSEL